MTSSRVINVLVLMLEPAHRDGISLIGRAGFSARTSEAKIADM